MNNVKEIVRSVLTDEPATRNDDALLYYKVARQIVPDVGCKSFLTVMCNMKALGLPQMETVRRHRQKAQQLYPELAADANTEAARELEQDKYLQIARMTS